MSEINLIINGHPVSVPKGTRILDAAKKANVLVPVLCDHPDLCKRAHCRICVVECDGGSKLLPACANNVWEGMNVVTNNSRIINARRTILELILASHPQECLSCIRNKKCELQLLAENFGIRSSAMERCSEDQPPRVEGETIVRNMNKCVKCGRCVEACQEVQTIRAINASFRGNEFEVCTPYGQALDEGPCVFCGQCADVCPVAAIHEHDQTAEVWTALNDSKRHVIAQVSAAIADELSDEMVSLLDDENGLKTKSPITLGKIIAAIKMLGLKHVYNAEAADRFCRSELCGELKSRSGEKTRLPVISGCSHGVSNFVNRSYPDLSGHLVPITPMSIFSDRTKSIYAATFNIKETDITTVSFVPCVAQKYGPGTEADGNAANFALTAVELARMIKLAGIDIAALQESHFDEIKLPHGAECTVEPMKVQGFAEARKMMESIRKGECEAKWVEILSCSNGVCTGIR